MSAPKSVVIDADSHLQQPLQWLAKKFPDMGMAVREPTSFSPVKYFVPEEHWPEDEAQMYTEPWLRFLQAQRQAFADGVDLDDMVADPDVELGALDRLFRGRGGWDTDERVGLLDELGIDVQLASGISLRMGSGEEWRHLTALGNTVTCEQIGRHQDRIVPIVDVDLTDLDWAIAELTRCRGLGSRVFNIPVEPVNGKSLSHPDNDRLWAAASDLGMLGYLHSFNDPLDPGWFNNGGDYLQLSMLSSVRYHHQAELLLTVLCAGGIFARFPNFGVVMAEIGGLAWIPNALQWMDAHVTDPSLREMQAIQPWAHDLLPSDYAERQLRVAPLPNQSQSPLPWLDQLGDIVIFSTDYPHPEGTPDPKIQAPDAASTFFRDEMAGIDQARRDRFFGASLAELFARRRPAQHRVPVSAGSRARTLTTLGGFAVGVAVIGFLLPAAIDGGQTSVRAAGGSAGGEHAGLDAIVGGSSTTLPDLSSPGAVGEAASPTPGRSGASAGATGGGLTASDVGVTSTTIRIGIWVPDIGAIAKIPGLGDTGFDPATYRAAYDAFADEINAQGGILGRKVELVYYTMDATNEPDSNQRGCVFFTQQEKVFALFTASVGYESSFDCIHRGSGAITYSTLGFEQRYYSGNWLVTQDASTNRVLRNLVSYFHSRGELRGKRIAIVEQARLKLYTDQIVLPALRSLGYEVVHRATMSDDTGQLGSQIPVEVNQMKAKGVNVALTLLNPAAAGLVIQNADQQLFRPRWMFSDFNAGTDDLGPRLFPAGTDAAGLTSLRTGEFRAGRPEPAYDASCASRYNARTKGKKARHGVSNQENPYRYALYGCTAFDRFKAAAVASGPTLTRSRWMAAIAGSGTVRVAFAADGTYAPGKTDAADQFRLVEFRASCEPDGNNCWMPSGEFSRPG